MTITLKISETHFPIPLLLKFLILNIEAKNGDTIIAITRNAPKGPNDILVISPKSIREIAINMYGAYDVPLDKKNTSNLYTK